ncbi:MAG: DUF1963 domain-containing protein [Bacteroidales bacterium]|nr:DUF1963 domain-containing protein [Bacteroidales bacterium]
MELSKEEISKLIGNAFEKADNISDEIKRQCPPQQCLRFSINREKQPSIFDSKLGGKPYWNTAMPYPTDEKGLPMVLVIQLNMEQCPQLQPLPSKGMIQFFISSDEEIICDGYGCNYDTPNLQTNYRVVYHNEVNYNLDPNTVSQYPTCEELEDYTPVKKECALNVEIDESCINLSCKKFDSLFVAAAKKLYNDDITDPFFNADEYLMKDMPQEFAHKIGPGLFDINPMYNGPEEFNFQMLGFPAFEQCDERDDNSKYDTLLLQIPTLASTEEDNLDDGYLTIWGDCGSMRIFINSNDLKQCSFSDVLYEFQCY